MTITKQVFRGQHALQDIPSPTPYEVTCHLVSGAHGLESMHILGWVTLGGTQHPVTLLGITQPGQTMCGREHDIARARIGQLCAAATSTAR